MKRPTHQIQLFTSAFTALVASVLLPSTIHAQGLLGIGHYGSEVSEASPLKLSVGVEGGYDSNTNTAPSGSENSSYFGGGGIGLFYAYANDLSRLDLGGNFGAQWYEDAGPISDDIFYNTRLSANASHRFSDRFRVTNNSLIAYEIEPNYLIGASIALREDQYLYWYNRTALWYQLSKRFSLVTGYAIQGINYEESLLSTREDRLTHVFSQQLRYSLSSKTAVRAEYRYAMTDYDSINYDYKSHYALGGIDHRFSETTAGTLVAGAEFREYDRFEKTTQPYVEAGLNYRMSTRTSLRWMARIGLENNEVFGFSERYSYRTGLTANHAINDRLRATAGVSFVRSDFEGAEFDSIEEHAVSGQIGLAYRVVQNVDLRLGYHYTNYSSDNSARDYDRSRVTIGATANF
ncbi:MAG: outer membrane beta-barrel protein [Verrucomicrobiales bacterium]|nr:outer membrane beta-barrel protein [Verrucomicrobiales bacterium]